MAKNLPSSAPQLPRSLDAERAVLGGLMMSGKDALEVQEILSEADFFSEEHQLVYRAIRKLSSAGKPHDWVLVAAEMENDVEVDRHRNPHALNSLERVDGGQAFVGQLAMDVAAASNVVPYARVVKEKAELRAIINAGTALAEMGFSPEGRFASEIVDEAQGMISRLGTTATAKEPVLMSSLLPGWQNDLEGRKTRKKGGLYIGLPVLDRAIGGLEAGDLVIVAGRPAMGKTAFGLGIAGHVARKGLPVLGFSLEMPAKQWISRLVCNFGGIPMGRLKAPWELDEVDYGNMATALGEINELPFRVEDQGGLSIKQVRSYARRVHHKTRLSLILIDYLQLMSGEGKRKDEFRSQEIEGITRGLKSLAKELNVPVIALSQLNRSLENRDDKRPRMSDLRESGGIENDADIIIGLYRESEYNRDYPFPNLAQALILKQRNGETGSHDLTYTGEFFRFSDWHGPTAAQRAPKKEAKTTGLRAMSQPAPSFYEPQWSDYQ